MPGSTFMAWLVVVGLVAVSTPRGSTRPPSWLRPVSRWRRRRVSWRAGSGARNARPAGMSSAPPRAGRWRRRRRPRYSRSSCRCGWWHGCGRTPPGRSGLSPRWSPRRWRSSCRGRADSAREGERAGGRDAVRLRSSRGGGIVGRLPHPGSRTAPSHWRGGRGSESW